MRREFNLPKITWDILEESHELYLQEEPRDAIYRVSTRLIENNWIHDYEVSNALGVLLLIWNSAFYRYGTLDYPKIENSITSHKKELSRLRKRHISSLDPSEMAKIEKIYNNFLFALRSGGKTGAKNEGVFSYSPVSAGKALHLLCPNFFPLWDNKIASAYRNHWKSSDTSFYNYWAFMKLSKDQTTSLYELGVKPDSLDKFGDLKLIDEYNYVVFTLKRKLRGR